MTIEDLRNEWVHNAMEWCDNSTLAENIFAELLKCYESDKRHYHNVEHIIQMLNLAKKLKEHIRCEKTVYFAIWFHDAIQEMHIDSEEESAKYAINSLIAMQFPSSIITNVYQLIHATKEHKSVNMQDGNVFIDIDMSILGLDRDTYIKYMHNCRKEYDVSDQIYKEGRLSFLKGLLEQESIFITELFRQKYESQAISNINYEILIHEKEG